ncbi:MAG: conjugal transfer protein TraF [Gammaproteobacteria bacterium]|nr:conjugal transfer protein TraF [Gammaproteobacteria bacterium]
MRLWIFLTFALVTTHHAQASGVDAATAGLGGAATATSGQRFPQTNPAGLALTASTADIRFTLPALTYERGPHLKIVAVAGQAALPRTPYALAAHAYHGVREDYYYNENLAAGQTFRVTRTDTGFTLAKIWRQTLGGTHRLAVGVRPQLVTLKTDLTQMQPGAHQAALFNADVGLIHEFDYAWKWGLKFTDLIAKDVPFKNSAEVYRLRPQTNIGINWRGTHVMWSATLDLLAQPGYGPVAAQQTAASGVEYRVIDEQLLLRAGLSTALRGSPVTCGHTGLGSHWAYAHLDVAYKRCTDDRQGVVMDMGVQF